MSCRALDASKCLQKLALCRCRAARSCLIVPMELSNRDFFLCFTYTPALLFRLNHRFVRVYTLPLHVTIIWPTGLVDSASWGCSWRHFLLSETIRKTLTMWALTPPPCSHHASAAHVILLLDQQWVQRLVLDLTQSGPDYYANIGWNKEPFLCTLDTESKGSKRLTS